MIFDQYLRDESEYRINIDYTAKINIYKKFGIYLSSQNLQMAQQESPNGKDAGQGLPIWPQQSESVLKNDVSGNSDEDYYEINEAVLMKNLNQYLFAELHNLTLKELNDAFEEFKKTDDFNILREDINR